MTLQKALVSTVTNAWVGNPVDSTPAHFEPRGVDAQGNFFCVGYAGANRVSWRYSPKEATGAQISDRFEIERVGTDSAYGVSWQTNSPATWNAGALTMIPVPPEYRFGRFAGAFGPSRWGTLAYGTELRHRPFFERDGEVKPMNVGAWNHGWLELADSETSGWGRVAKVNHVDSQPARLFLDRPPVLLPMPDFHAYGRILGRAEDLLYGLVNEFQPDGKIGHAMGYIIWDLEGNLVDFKRLEFEGFDWHSPGILFSGEVIINVHEKYDRHREPTGRTVLFDPLRDEYSPFPYSPASPNFYIRCAGCGPAVLAYDGGQFVILRSSEIC